MDDKKESYFGFKKIQANLKQDLVNKVFSSVAKKYDLMNDLMSLGIHRYWKKELCNYFFDLNGSLLDLAGGTGDVAFLFYKKAKKCYANPKVTVCDINYDMLEYAREKAINNGIISGVSYINGDAENLPFTDNCFDYISIAFGIRNVTNIDLALKEAYRVLRPGGRFVCLEFSKLDTPVIKQLYDLYSFKLIPSIGNIVTNDRDSYQYLVESIRTFPEKKVFCKMLEKAYFESVITKSLTFGIVNIYLAHKPKAS